MSEAAKAFAPLFEVADVEELERDIQKRSGVRARVMVNPRVDAPAEGGRKKRIPIPADDVVRTSAVAVAQPSWLDTLRPVDLEALVEHAFSSEVLSAVTPPEPAADDDDGIDVDIDVDDVDDTPEDPALRATSGEIEIASKASAAAEETGAAGRATIEVDEGPTAGAGEAAAPVPAGASAPPPTPVDASGPPPPPPSAGAPTPPPVPMGASTGEAFGESRPKPGAPPPVPLAAFTGEREPELEPEPEDAAAAEPGAAGESPAADMPLHESEDSTAVDEEHPMAFPDQGTPPPIPLEAATPILASFGAAKADEARAERKPEEGEAKPPPLPVPTAAPPKIPADAKGALAAQDSAPEPAAAPPLPPPAPPKKKKKKRFKKPWFEEFFDDDYLRTIAFMTPASTAKEAEYVREKLGVAEGASLLDVGCGYGRLAIRLASKGFAVTGLDTSLPLMFLAAEASNEAGVEVNFMHQDMREMSFDSEFDGVYCVMTSFGYFDDDTNRDVVKRIFRAIKPGGRFFLEVINRDFILPDLPSRVWWEGDECVVMDEVEFNYLTSRIVSKRSVVFADGRSVNHDLSIRAYCLHELGRMLHNAGFRVVSVTGNINTENRFFGQHSPYLIILSEKPE